MFLYFILFLKYKKDNFITCVKSNNLVNEVIQG